MSCRQWQALSNGGSVAVTDKQVARLMESVGDYNLAVIDGWGEAQVFTNGTAVEGLRPNWVLAIARLVAAPGRPLRLKEILPGYDRNSAGDLVRRSRRMIRRELGEEVFESSGRGEQRTGALRYCFKPPQGFRFLLLRADEEAVDVTSSTSRLLMSGVDGPLHIRVMRQGAFRDNPAVWFDLVVTSRHDEPSFLVEVALLHGDRRVRMASDPRRLGRVRGGRYLFEDRNLVKVSKCRPARGAVVFVVPPPDVALPPVIIPRVLGDLDV